MSIPGKVLIALLCALAAAAAFSTLNPELSLVGLLPPAAVAALAAVLLSHRALPMPGALASSTAREPVASSATGTAKSKGQGAEKAPAKPAARASRNGSKGKREPRAKRNDGAPQSAAPNAKLEEGTVKWFNVTKGYGFIVRANGEEIFVHHRSVQGEGRGRLDDGAAVRFRVASTDKGPQAEDVQAI